MTTSRTLLVLFALSLAACKPQSSNGPAVDRAPVPTTDPTAEPARTPDEVARILSGVKGKGTPRVLRAGESLTGTYLPGRAGKLSAFGIQIGNYHASSDGTLSLRICAAQDCREATVPLAGSRDNDFLVFALGQPLSVTTTQALEYTLTRSESSTNRLAIWTYPTTGEQNLLLDATGNAQRVAPHLALYINP